MAGKTPQPDESTADARVRLDKWLWAARFFKTRQLATDAINGGKIHLNGQRAKPGKEIGVGARIEISKEQYLWDVTVKSLSSQRGPAKRAVVLYEESAASLEKRLAEINRRREEKAFQTQPDQRPSKKDRRLIHRFKREDFGD